MSHPNPAPDPNVFPAAANPDREPVQLFVIGSTEGINHIILTLHRLRFAEVNEWSPLLPAPTPGKLMRTLTRHRSSSLST